MIFHYMNYLLSEERFILQTLTKPGEDFLLNINWVPLTRCSGFSYLRQLNKTDLVLVAYRIYYI